MGAKRLVMAPPKSAVSSPAKQATPRPRLPDWFRTVLPTGEKLSAFNRTKDTVTKNTMATVCVEARCPNIHECWGRGTATFMIAGEECTRGCRFCAVGTIKSPPPLDADEPARLADSVSTMGLTHAVITVVNRDDLADSGASHYKQCITAVHELCPDTTLELLCSDLAGDFTALSMLLQDSPLAVFAHNVECVPRLDKTVRDHRASFSQSLSILEEAKRLRPDILTKSSIMVGMGETPAEVVEALQMLRASNVDIITLGQYLAPSAKHLAVSSFPTPKQFEEWADVAKEMGFCAVASGPLVRSSYRAGELLAQIVQINM